MLRKQIIRQQQTDGIVDLLKEEGKRPSQCLAGIQEKQPVDLRLGVGTGDASEEQVLDVALAIIQNTPGIKDDIKSLQLSDVKPYIGRNKTYELSSRVNSLAALINIGIAPEIAIPAVDIFADPQQVAIDSAPRINSLLGLAGDGSRMVDDMGEEVPEEEVPAALERLADNAWNNYGENRDLLRGQAEV